MKRREDEGIGEIERELERELKRMLGKFKDMLDYQEGREDDEIEKERKNMRENFIKAIENGEKIKKKDFYIYMTLENIKIILENFVKDFYAHDGGEAAYDCFAAIAKPLAEKLSTIKYDKNIEQNLSAFFSSLHLDTDKKKAEYFVYALTDMETSCRGKFPFIHECLADSEGDATEMFLDEENEDDDEDPKINALRAIVERRKDVKIVVLNEKFKDDISRLDDVLKKRLKDIC